MTKSFAWEKYLLLFIGAHDRHCGTKLFGYIEYSASLSFGIKWSNVSGIVGFPQYGQDVNACSRLLEIKSSLSLEVG